MLPKGKNGYIMWSQSVGYTVPFYYNDILYNFIIVSYRKEKKRTGYLTIQFNGKQYVLSCQAIRRNNINQLIKDINTTKSTTQVLNNKKPDKNIYVVPDLSNIPKNNMQYSWADSVGKTIQYTYKNISGCIYIKEYKDGQLYCINKTNGRERYIRPGNIVSGKFVTFVNEKGEQSHREQKAKYNIGDYIYSNSGKQFKVIGVSFRDYKHNDENDKYKKSHIYYLIKCMKCSYCFWASQYNIDNVGCGACSGEVVIPGINDITTTAPWMMPFFKNIEEASKYTKNSYKQIYPICPYCGKQSNKMYHINNIYNWKGFRCTCSDKISYPEKYMINFLEQAGIDFIFQASTNQLKFDTDKKVYDFYIPTKNVILETHGIQHYEPCSLNNYNVKETHDNDIYKRDLAIQNGIQNYFEIDCRYSDGDWIKKNIISSNICKLFNINKDNIDWKICAENAMSNLALKVCNYYNEHDVSINDLKKIFHIGEKGIKTYLAKGAELGWCQYKASSTFFVSRPFEVYDMFDNYIGYAKSAKEYSRVSDSILNIHLDYNGIRKCLMGETEFYKGYKFKQIKDFQKRREVLCKDDSELYNL